MIGTLMKEQKNATFNYQAFSEGVMASRIPGGLLHQLFSVRARGLSGQMDHLEDYLSGLLIGAELESQGIISPILLIGEDTLCQRYKTAIEILYPETSIHFESSKDAIIRGASNLWEKLHA